MKLCENWKVEMCRYPMIGLLFCTVCRFIHPSVSSDGSRPCGRGVCRRVHCKGWLVLDRYWHIATYAVYNTVIHSSWLLAAVSLSCNWHAKNIGKSWNVEQLSYECNLKLLNYKLQVNCNWITNYKLLFFLVQLQITNYNQL